MPICNYSKLVKLGDILQMTKSKLNIQFIAKTKFKKKAVELPISFGGAQRSGKTSRETLRSANKRILLYKVRCKSAGLSPSFPNCLDRSPSLVRRKPKSSPRNPRLKACLITFLIAQKRSQVAATSPLRWKASLHS